MCADRASVRRRPLGLDAWWTATAIVTGLPLVANILGPGGLHVWERAGAVLVVALAAWRPFDSLLLLAAFAPLGITVKALAGGTVSAVAWLLPALLLGSAVAVVRRRAVIGRAPTWLVGASLVLAWLALTSVAVQIGRDRVLFESTEAWRHALLAFLGEEHFTRGSRWLTTITGIRLAGQVLLVPLVAAVVTHRGAAARLTDMLVLGAAAAACQNVLRIVMVALRSGDVYHALPDLARAQRIAAAFPDFNAAGSFFALGVLLTAGVTWSAARESRPARVVVTAAAVILTGAALVLSGSRVATAAMLPPILAAVLLQPAGQPRARRLVAMVAAIAVAAALLATAQARRTGNDVPLAWTIRVEFARTTWRMLRDHPLFGVGAGAYVRSSGRYSSETLRQFYRSENAHNNFLQVAGELGPMAFVAFAVLTVGPVVIGMRAIRARSDRMLIGAWSGVTAFLLSCLGGHPLLIPEVAAFLAVTLGLLAALARGDATEEAAPRPSIVRGFAAIWLALVAVTPARVAAEQRTMNLSGVIVGKGRWTNDGGLIQATFAQQLTLYVPARDRPVHVVLRALGKTTPVEVAFHLDERLVNVVRLEGTDWMSVPLRVPTQAAPFRLLRLEVRTREARTGRGPRVAVQLIDPS